MVVTSRAAGIKTERLTARKTHYCITQSHACTGPVEAGEVYLMHTCYPGHDAHDGYGPPWRGAECAACARAYGRGAEVDQL